MSIHTRIKERRIAAGYSSHKALGDALGVSWQTVQSWEREDGTAPKRDRMKEVAELLKCSVEYLTTGRGIGLAEVEKMEKEGPPPVERMSLQYITPREVVLLENYRLSYEEGREKIEISAQKTKKKSVRGVSDDESQDGSV